MALLCLCPNNKQYNNINMSKNKVRDSGSNELLEDEKYFEQQSTFSQLCGLHSLNNILKKKAFTQDKMTKICYDLSGDIINPHKHIFGGDYDVNVLVVALQEQKYVCDWVNKTKQFKLSQYLEETQNSQEELKFLINAKLQKKIYHSLFRLSARHWYAIREQKGEDKKSEETNERFFIKCDSKMKQVRNYESIMELQDELKKLVSDRDTQVLWVHKASKEVKQANQHKQNKSQKQCQRQIQYNH